VKSQWIVFVEYLTISTIKHVVDDNIIWLLATQLMHEPEHGERSTVQ